MKNENLYAMLIGSGVPSGTAEAVRYFKPEWDKYASAIGAAAGVAVGGALFFVKKTKSLGVQTMIASGVFSAPAVIKDLLLKPSAAEQRGLIAQAVNSIQGGDVAGAGAALAGAFGIVTADRLTEGVTAGMLGAGNSDVDVLGLTVAEQNGYSGGSSSANLGTSFGAIPVAGIN